MTTYARIATRTAFLFSEFGESRARAWFGDSAVDALPKYSKGKHKGKPKGMLVWVKVESGGWARNGHGNGGGYVESRVGQVIEKRIHELAPWGSAALYGKCLFDSSNKQNVLPD